MYIFILLYHYLHKSYVPIILRIKPHFFPLLKVVLLYVRLFVCNIHYYNLISIFVHMAHC